MAKRNRTTKGRHWPSFESAFLADVVDALRKRSKSIKHQVGSYSCERVWHEYSSEKFEIAELYFELPGSRPFRVSCHMWNNRWLWIDVRQATVRRPVEKGWAFEWSHEGRVGDVPPREIMEVIEKSFLAPYWGDPTDIASELNDVWTRIAVNGPFGPV